MATAVPRHKEKNNQESAVHSTTVPVTIKFTSSVLAHAPVSPSVFKKKTKKKTTQLIDTVVGCFFGGGKKHGSSS